MPRPLTCSKPSLPPLFTVAALIFGGSALPVLAPPPPPEAEEPAPAPSTLKVPAREESTGAERFVDQEVINGIPPGDFELPKKPKPASALDVYVVPVRDQIAPPTAYVIRRAIKEAVGNEVEVIVLDMNTPGGRVDVTLDIMDMLQKFEGETLTFINTEAISAGAYISLASSEVHFRTGGIVGAAAVVGGSGQEVPESMKQKIDSYLQARIRVISEDRPLKGEAMRAMMDAQYELAMDGKLLAIDGRPLKQKDELLTLTAKEAMHGFGEPLRPLFGDGIHTDIDALLTAKYGAGNYTRTDFEQTWAEDMAYFLTMVSPLLIGAGLLCIFIELRTPGFGVMGIAGLILVGLVFLGNYGAGLAGYEPILLFLLGLSLVVLELFVIPGTTLVGLAGALAMLGSLIWSAADFWPDGGGGISIDAGALRSAIIDTMLGFILSIVLMVIAARFLPKTSLWSRLVLSSVSGPELQPAAAPGMPPSGPGTPTLSREDAPEPGTEGFTVTPLRPTGTVDIGGRQFEASLGFGSLGAGEPVVVRGKKGFYVHVEAKRS